MTRPIGPRANAQRILSPPAAQPLSDIGALDHDRHMWRLVLKYSSVNVNVVHFPLMSHSFLKDESVYAFFVF